MYYIVLIPSPVIFLLLYFIVTGPLLKWSESIAKDITSRKKIKNTIHLHFCLHLQFSIIHITKEQAALILAVTLVFMSEIKGLDGLGAKGQIMISNLLTYSWSHSTNKSPGTVNKEMNSSDNFSFSKPTAFVDQKTLIYSYKNNKSIHPYQPLKLCVHNLT